MCGIVGYSGNKKAADVVMNGLNYLEYRGYDSAGISVLKPQQNVFTIKEVGKLKDLKNKILDFNLTGNVGMGHTRWATHGVPSLANAHPHTVGKISLVHNGILENHQELRQKLIEQGKIFSTDTDSEVAACLLDDFLQQDHDPLRAINKMCDMICGSFAFGIMINGDERIYFAKRSSPLIVAKGEGESFFASDQSALVDYRPQYTSLDDFDYGYLESGDVRIFNKQGLKKKINWQPLTAKKEAAQKGIHKHFMHKEIFEQPETIKKVLSGRIIDHRLELSGFDVDFSKLNNIDKVYIVACGSSYFAGLLVREKLEEALKLPVSVEIASEYRYRKTLTDHKTMVIAISQSGETIDTLEALKKAKSLGASCLSICNVLGSAIAQECAKSMGNIFLNAGPEISVACTKAFIAQLVALRLFVLAVLELKGNLSKLEVKKAALGFTILIEQVELILKRDNEIRDIAKSLMNSERMLFLGRGDFYPIALEGALKLKELSYIFAEGYPAGELKHGPIATIDPGMKSVVILGSDHLSQKTQSNMQEIKARGASIILFAPNGNEINLSKDDIRFEYGRCSTECEPILATIPLQLLAYHLAELKGLDVDQPRNLAKSVTVE